jgi:predicted Zn-dependent protease with MMP-like domain
MDRQRFEQLVAAAVESLPKEFLARLENIDVVVEDEPTRTQLRRSRMRRGETLLGLYEGVPRTQRSTFYGLVPPDKITIFQKPIEAICPGDDEVKKEIQRVVRHEIAHHFGISDARLSQLEKRHPRRAS